MCEENELLQMDIWGRRNLCGHRCQAQPPELSSEGVLDPRWPVSTACLALVPTP